MKSSWPGSLIGTALLVGLGGCEPQDVPQSVIVSIDGAQMVGAEGLRLYAGMECAGEFVTPVRESNVYSFSTHSLKGGFGEVTQELALCIARNQETQLLWSSRHGGGARRIELKCSASTCDEKFTY